MAENNAIDEAYLQSLTNQQTSALDNVLAQQTETLDQLVNRKKEDLGLKSEEKTNDFISQNISINDIADADTLFNLGRLYGGEGDLSFDAYETAKYDDNNELIPYLGSIEPKDGSKRSKKWNLHRKAYAKMNGIRDYTMVSQRMLNEEAAKQTENFKAALLKGQDSNSGQIAVDIRQDGEGYYGRPLITVRNPITGEIINEVMNTADNNAMFYSNYNKDAYIEGVLKLEEATTNYNERKYSGEGFWVSAAKGLNQGVNGLQATGWGMSALIADAIGGKRGEAAASWFIEQYLSNLEEAQAKGAQLPSVENVDWSNPNEALSKFGALLGEAMPSIALMIGTGGLAGLIAKATQAGTKAGVKKLVKNEVGDRAAKIIARSQAAGAYGAAMVMETGSIYGDVAAAGERDSKAIWGSLAGGTIAGALEAFYPVKLMKKFGLSKAKVNKSTNDRILANNLKENFQAIGAGLLTGGAQEGTTEMLQFVVEEITQDLIKEGHLPDFNSAEFKSGLLNSFVAGLVPGSTLSGGASLVSETRNRIRGDEGATQQSVDESRQEVLEAVNEESVGEANVQSIENTAVNINNIENSAGSLGIELNDSYRKNKSVADKASWLADALNKLEIEQKSLPKGERNIEVIKARKAIEKALNNLNTGSASISRQAKEQVINQRAARARIGVTSKKALRDIAKKQEIDLKLLETKQTRYNKKGVEVLTKQIDTEIKKINSINEQLKDPNLSKAKIKNLKRLRNQLGVKVDKLSKDNDGTKLVDLDSQVFKNIDNVLNSFEFQNRKSTIREQQDVITNYGEIVEDDVLEEVGAETIKVFENPKSTGTQRASANNKFAKLFNKAKEVKRELEKQLKTVTDKKERKDLQIALKAINKKIENVSKVIEVLAEQEKTETDVLYSLNPLTGKQIEELKKLEGLSKTEQALLDAHIEVYKTKQEVDDNKKDIDDVRNDVLVGEKVFQGFMHYLKLAQKKSSSAVSNIKEFLNLLNDKLNRFEDAQKILKDENIKTVWISKNNYQDPILRTMPTIEKDGKQVEDKDNYFFVNAKSVRLMQSIKEEIEFGEAVLALITKATSKATTKEKEALDKAVNEAKESQVKKPVTDKDLDDIKTENVKIDKKEKPKTETGKPIVDSFKDFIDSIKNLNKNEAYEEIYFKYLAKATRDLEQHRYDDLIAVIKSTKRSKGKKIDYDELLRRLDGFEKRINDTYRDGKAPKLKVWTKADIEVLFSDEFKEQRWDPKFKNRGEEQAEERRLKKVKEKASDIHHDSIEAWDKLQEENTTEESAATESDSKSKVIHLLNKFKNSFPKIRDSKFTAFDIFKIAQPKRKSIYSKNEGKDITDVTAILTEMGIEDKAFIAYLDKYFVGFKKNYEKFLRVKPKQDNGLFTSEHLINLLLVEVDTGKKDNNGNPIIVKKLPDDVLFAMMVSTLDWISINKYNSEVTDEQVIALMLYGDRKASLTREEIAEFGSMGIRWSQASQEIGREVWNNLNLKINSGEFKGLDIDGLIAKYKELEKDNNAGVLRDDSLAEQLQIALGQQALAIAGTVHPSESKYDFDGLIQLTYGQFHHPTFKNDKNSKKTSRGWQREIKVIKFPYLQKEDIPFDLENLFKSFRNNRENIETINGTGSTKAGPLPSASKIIQKFVRKSVIPLPKRTYNLIKKLQNVEWSGKAEALNLFEIVDSDKATMHRLIELVNLDIQHNELKEGYENSNNDKLKDLELVRDYIETGSLSFWFRYAAQKQNRVRIDSNGINGQRSKIHRALFMPKSARVTIGANKKTAEFERANYQLSIAQAFGFDIDKNDLKASLLFFDKVYADSKQLRDHITSKNKDSKEFNKLLNEFLDINDGVYKPSMHILEGLASLANYSATKPFQSAALGIETDGITNGYAIALMQFLGVAKGTEDENIVSELVKSMARIGVMIEPEMTMEKFIQNKNLDVYESLAEFIRTNLDTAENPDIVKTINKDTSGPRIDENHLKALTVIHGNLWDDVKGKVSSFGRSLAKNPLMISGYGAELERIVSALAADIIPNVYEELAKFQVARENAKTKEAKKQFDAEFKNYIDALNLFIPIKEEMDSYIKEGENLKEFVFSKKEIFKIEKAFKKIFNPPITSALNQFTVPLKAARDAIIRSGELQYTAFKFKYDEAIAKYKITEGKVPHAVKERIAKELALKHMPLIYGPWSNKTPLEIIKDQRSSIPNEGRIDTIFKEKQLRDAVRVGNKFKALRGKSRGSVSSNVFSREYTAPSVSMYSNTIQNIDSVILGEALEQNPEVLAIFDALMSNTNDAYQNSENYNESFRRVARDYSVLEKALARLLDAKSTLSSGELETIENTYRYGVKKNGTYTIQPSFEAKAILKKIKNAKDEETKTKEEEKLANLGFDKIIGEFNDEITRVNKYKDLLEQAYPGWLENATISQMYLPESLKLIKDGSATIEDIKAGADIDTRANDAVEDTNIENFEENVTVEKGFFNNLKFSEIKKAINRDDKASKSFGWVSTWYGPINYEYSGIKHPAQEMSAGFANLARKLEKQLGHPEGYFNSALMNVFPKGKGIGKHADDEFIYIRSDDTIGSVATISLGGTSDITISRNDKSEADRVFTIENGDLYVMPDGRFQLDYKHQVGKANAERISMTFRHIPKNQLKEEKIVTDEIVEDKVGPTQQEEATEGDPYVLFKDDKGKDVLTNAGQTRAIDTLNNWWRNNIKEKIFVLSGRGGTGKTTIVDKAIQVMGIEKNQVRFGLPTHKAKGVIEKAAKNYGSDQFSTIAQLLGKKPKGYDKDGNQLFVTDPEAYENSLDNLSQEGVKLIVIDEASMVGVNEITELLDVAKRKGIRLLFMGDQVQLPPISKDKTKLYLSAVFANVLGLDSEIDLEINKKVSYAKLTKRMRQKGESPILGITDIIANSIEYIIANIDKYNGTKKNMAGFILPKINNALFKLGKNEGVFYAKGKQGTGATDATIDQFVEEYKKDPENVKYLWYFRPGNPKTLALKARIREKLFPNRDLANDLDNLPVIKGEQIVIGETARVYDAAQGSMIESDLHNGDTVVVTKEAEVKNLDFQVMQNRWEGIPVNVIEVETVSSEGPLKRYKLVIEHKDTQSVLKSKFKPWMLEPKTFKWFMPAQLNSTVSGDLAAGYLMNVHKAQGSTYKTVYADYDNTLDIYGPSWFDQLSGLYVATSRPTTKLVLVGTGDLEFGEVGSDLTENLNILKALESGKIYEQKDTQELYSLDNDLDIEMKALWDTDSVANTAQNIFNKLSNHFKSYYPTKEEQSTQESHLQRVLDEIILPTGNALDNVSVELFAADVKAFGAVSLKNKNISVVLNNKKPSSFSEQTAQEAYVHELIHIITNSPLAKNASFRNDITRIRNSVKAELEKMDRPYEIFLHKDADGNIITLTDAKTEIESAKEQYNYLFGPNKSEFILDEFLAYSLTNKHLVRELSKIPAKVVPLWNRKSDTHVLEKIIDFFTELVKRFVNVMQKKPISGTLDKEIFQITKEMVNASHSQAGKVRNILQRQNFAKDYDKANEAASTFLKDMVSRGIKFGSDQYIKGVDKLTKDGKINNFFANVLYDSKLAVLMTSSYGKFVNDNPKVQRYLDAAFKNFKPGLKQNLASLKADAFGGVNEDFIRLLYKSQKEVDVARRQYKQLTADSLLNEFQDLESLNQDEKEAITRVLFKSDFATLIGTETYSMKDAIRLLNDDKYLDEQITKYAEDLDIKNDNHYAAQTKSLAEWMMVGNQFNTNQFKNAHVIFNTNPNKPKGTIEDLDVYITLLALRDHVEPFTKNQIKNVVNREFKLNKDHNGITNTIYHHIAFKENTLKENFDDNPVLTSKGYIADIVNPNIQIEFAATDAETQKRMKDADYEFISGFETITGVNDSQYGIYVNRNLPDAMRTKGIASVTSKHFAGSSFKEIMSRNPATEGQINLLFRRFKEQQTKKQNTLDKYHTMMPLLNEKNEIVDYTIHMNHVFKEQILEQELSFDQVLPTMYSHSLDKASSEKINREAIDLLDTHTTLNYDKEPQKYINLLEGENREEYFNVLPRDARNHILDLAKKNKDKKLAFYVERKLLDTVFGYKMPSIGNAPIIRSNKKIQKQVKIAEKMMFELVALSKVNIVIKIPAVLGFNIVSNFMTSMIYGIPPTYLLKKWREGFKELERYQKEHKKLQLLELKQVGNPSLRNDPKIENDKKIIIKSLNDNKVAKLMDMGLFNSITEDINKNDFTYRHQTMNTLRNTKIGKKFDNRFKGKAVKLANQAYIGEETALFKTMMHLTQASDFIARYAMYSHAIEVKNMDENKAFKQMVETFVNYDQPLNRYLQYGNDIGLLFFVKYWLRIQRATFNIAKEKPLNIGMLYVGNTMLGLDIESIMESSILTGNFFPSTGGPLKVIEEIVMLPGLEILSGESLGLG